MLAADHKGLVRLRYRDLSMKFVLPMAVTLLLIQLAAAFCISKNQGAKIEQDLYTRGQGLVEAIAGISATFLVNYDMTALEDIVTSLRRQDGVQWAVFFDAKSRPLTTTKDMVQDDSAAVFVRQITMDSKSIGSFKLGLSTTMSFVIVNGRLLASKKTAHCTPS